MIDRDRKLQIEKGKKSKQKREVKVQIENGNKSPNKNWNK